MRCSECGLPWVGIDGHRSHPACDPVDPDAARIRAQYEAQQRAIAGMDQAAATSPDDFTLALALINRAAIKQRTLTANDLRDDPRWDKIASKVRGSAFNTAARKGWISKIGYETSTLQSTNGHDLKKWASNIFLDELRSGMTSGRAS